MLSLCICIFVSVFPFFCGGGGVGVGGGDTCRTNSLIAYQTWNMMLDLHEQLWVYVMVIIRPASWPVG